MYKVELYISKCLNSITDQLKDSNIELIIVDDGSPDRSGEIAKGFAYSNDRIFLLTQSNKGLSSARNLGLSKSHGEYVWFIDSDDWIAEDSLIEIIKTINTYHPDAIHICGADVIDNNPVKLFSLSNCSNIAKNGIDMIKENNFHGVVQYTIYKKDILDRFNLKFLEGIYHEDTEFSPRAYYYLNNIRCIDKILYLKRVNDDSITRTVNFKKNEDLIKVSESLRHFALTKCDDKNRPLYMRLASNALKMAMRNEVNQLSSTNKIRLNKLLYLNNNLFKSFLESDLAYYRVIGLFHRLFPNHHLQVSRFIDIITSGLK